MAETWGPLLTITLPKETYDEFMKRMREAEAEVELLKNNWHAARRELGEVRKELKKAKLSLITGGYEDRGGEVWVPPVNMEMNRLRGVLDEVMKRACAECQQEGKPACKDPAHCLCTWCPVHKEATR
jgi:hypothetical protein